MPDEMYYQMRFLWDNWNEIEIIEIKMRDIIILSTNEIDKIISSR